MGDAEARLGTNSLVPTRGSNPSNQSSGLDFATAVGKTAKIGMRLCTRNSFPSGKIVYKVQGTQVESIQFLFCTGVKRDEVRMH